MYAIVGYGTVYQYYAYPKNIRPRISQVLVLPPFQRQGIGATMLRTIYNYYAGVDEVLDITGQYSTRFHFPHFLLISSGPLIHLINNYLSDILQWRTHLKISST